ncbi:MAG: HU family DNA-binding protein [Proteobacteria bacterium]|nr:HU family DNA-binding protein [Pseudomonadota bacterium]
MQAKVAAKALKSSKPAKTAKAPAKAAKAPKPGKGDTVTLRHLGNAISESHSLPKKQANEILVNMVEMITTHLKKGARIRIGGLGILQVKKRPARMGRNPATGEAIKIKASKKVAFRAAKELKEAV